VRCSRRRPAVHIPRSEADSSSRRLCDHLDSRARDRKGIRCHRRVSWCRVLTFSRSTTYGDKSQTGFINVSNSDLALPQHPVEGGPAHPFKL